MTRREREAQAEDTGFYADYDSESALWCVFGDRSDFAYESYADRAEAKERAKAMTAAKHATEAR